MDAITERLARQQVAQSAARARRSVDTRRPRATARHSLASSLRRFADRIDS